MAVKEKRRDFRRYAKLAAEASHDKKARTVEILDIRKESDLADYIVIAEADSSAQMRALEVAIEEALRAVGLRALRREGRPNQRWMAIDYGGLLVHLMLPQAREFYRLEQMWEHAKEVKA